MKVAPGLAAVSLAVASISALTASADNGSPPPTFSTLVSPPLPIEGLTGDERGDLYTAGRTPGAGVPCPVWRVSINAPVPALVLVGNIPAPSATAQCSPLGLAFDRARALYVAESDKIYRLVPNAGTPPTATVFASGVPGANGVAFDRDGNLWTSDGTTGQYRRRREPGRSVPGQDLLHG